MANVLNGNTFYIDTQGSTTEDDLVRKQTLVTYITITSTGANGRVVLSDVGTNPTTKIDLRVAVANTSELFRYAEKPLMFPNGIKVSVLTNAVVTVVIANAGG